MTKSEQLNLRGEVGKKLSGKALEVSETEEGILLRPVEDPIRTARGFLKGSRFSTERYAQLKAEEKGLER